MKTIAAAAAVSMFLVAGAAAGTFKTGGTDREGRTGMTGSASGSAMMSDASYMVVTSDSRLNWTGKKTGGEHYGTVRITEGAFRVSDGKMTAGDFVIDMTSITVDDIESEGMNRKLVNHLKSEDFFNTGAHPRAYFKMKEGKFVKGDASRTDRYEITGTLTIKDISHDISFNAYVSEDGSMIKTDVIALDRTRWEVNFKSKTIFAELADNYIHDEMYISVELAVR